MQAFAYSMLVKFFGLARTDIRPFVVYGIAYSLLGLLIPVIVQFMVNNLALAGLSLNLFTLAVVLVLGLGLHQACKLAQIYLAEALERKFMAFYTPRFRGMKPHYRCYYFELAALPKSLSKWALDGFEIFLTLVVSSLILMAYHPYLVVFTLVLWGCLWGIHRIGERGIQTALEESNQKYDIWHKINDPSAQVSALDWLKARELHFIIQKRQLLLLASMQIVGLTALVIGGALLFTWNQISLGQFVGIELIGGGLFLAIGKLSKFIDTHYAFMTSLLKIERALGGEHG